MLFHYDVTQMRLTVVEAAILRLWPILKTNHRGVTKLVSKDAEDTISHNRSRGLEGLSAVEKELSQKNYFFYEIDFFLSFLTHILLNL